MAKTQNQKVLNYMLNNGSIDCCRAVRDLGVYRLSARIKDLRNQGVPIATNRKYVKTPDGYKFWAEYSVEEGYYDAS